MTQQEKLYPFELFDEQFQELLNSGMIKNWKDKKYNFNINFESDEIEITRQFPNNDEIKSFLLTFRFFIQDNEACSLKNLSKHYRSLDVSQNLKDKFNQTREKVNQYLDSYTGIKEEGKKKYTYRDILEIYIYGKYAHSNKRKEVKDLLSSEVFEVFMKSYFLLTLLQTSQLLNVINEINKEAVKELNQS